MLRSRAMLRAILRAQQEFFKKLSEKELSEGFEQSCRDVTFLLKRSFWPLLGVDGRGTQPSRGTG